MNEYIRQWNEVIVNGSVDNTYKMAWARNSRYLNKLLRKDWKYDIFNKKIL